MRIPPDVKSDSDLSRLSRWYTIWSTNQNQEAEFAKCSSFSSSAILSEKARGWPPLHYEEVGCIASMYFEIFLRNPLKFLEQMGNWNYNWKQISEGEFYIREKILKVFPSIIPFDFRKNQ